MTTTNRTIQHAIPGTNTILNYELNPNGELLRLECAGRCYIRYEDGVRIVDEDLARVSEVVAGGTLVRRVEAAGIDWTETYRFDSQGILNHVDGVDILRDEAGRIASCMGPEGYWKYRYDERDRLLETRGPGRSRRLVWKEDLLAGYYDGSQYHDLEFDASGVRIPADPPPSRWVCDELGRLWIIFGPDGEIEHTYLWYGFACLGRIDGPPGRPMAETYSLDPSSTPVRIIKRDRVIRVPRDAFAEGLAVHPEAPGLHGGAQFGNMVHYRARRLDPRIGLYDRPDPWDGSTEDPRRIDGYRGTLAVEDAHPYTVCQNDPVSRIDPTGESSVGVAVLVHISSFTWGMQNNVLGWFGLDWSLNFWATFITGLWQFGPLGPFFDFQGFTGQRQKTFAVRRAGLLSSDRAWTLQHLIWNEADHIDETADVHLVDPQGRWTPRLYGSVIRVDPSEGDTFLLRGDNGLDDTSLDDLLTWTRAGGIGEPLYPGSNTPYFSRGALHLDAPIDGFRAYDPIACDISELEPTGSFFTVSFTRRTSLTIETSSIEGGHAGLDTLLVLVTDEEGHAGIFLIEVAERLEDDTILWLNDAPNLLGSTALRARMLDNAVVSSELAVVGPAETHLNLAGIAGPADYDPGQPIRFLDTATGNVVGAGLITGFETGLQFTNDLPTGLAEPFEIEEMTVVDSGTARFTGEDDELDFQGAAPPAIGCFLQISYNGNTLLSRVTEVAGSVVTLEPNLSSLGGTQQTTETVAYDSICGTNRLFGRRSEALDSAALDTVIYVAEETRQAPAVNDFVLIRDNAGVENARQVQSLLHDALVFQDPIPGGIGADVTGERYALIAAGQPRHLDEADVSLETIVTAPLTPDASLDGDVLLLVQYAEAEFSTPTTTAWTYTGLTGAVATGPATTPALVRPTQFVILQQGSLNEHALVQRVGLQLTFDRDLGMDGETGAEIVGLQTYGFNYRLEHVAGQTFTVHPELAAGGTDVLQIPHFRVGELVQLQGTGFTAGHAYRVIRVEGHGSTIELSAGIPLPPIPGDLSLLRLQPVNPNNGSVRLGIEGRDISTTAGQSNAVFDVWDPDDFSTNQLVAVIKGDGTLTEPALVDSRGDISVTFAQEPTLDPAAGNVNVMLPQSAGNMPTVAYATQVRQDASTGNLVGLNDTLVLGANPVVAIPLTTTNSTSGELSPGTTYVPNDVDDDELCPMELDRRQALIDHELRHTEQQALIGPWFFGFFPMAFFEFFPSVSTTSRSIWEIADTPRLQYSVYVDGRIERNEQGDKILIIQETQGVPFAAEDLVQISHMRGEAHGQFTLTTSDDGPDAYLILGSPPPGNVIVGRAGTPISVPGRVERIAGGGARLRVFDTPSDLLHSGDQVTLFPMVGPQTVTLQIQSEDRFGLPESTDVREGPVRVRRMESGSVHWQRFHDVLNMFTAGGVAKFLFSTTYGGMIELFARLGFWISRWGKDEEKSATIHEGNPRALAFSGDRVPSDIRESRQVRIRSGENTAIRAVERAELNRLFLREGISFTGDFKVSPYPSQAGIGSWDWHHYFDATVPDPTSPNVIRLETSGDGAPEFAPFDRVVTSDGSTHFDNIRVVGVRPDGQIELEKNPETTGEDRRLRIAEARAVDRLFFDLAERDGVRIPFDPWGELLHLIPIKSDFAKGMVAFGKSVLSTQQWSVLPVLGYYFFDNMIPQIAGSGHRSRIEQDASEESGDLYSPLSRLRPRKDAIERVGDIGLFWYWAWANFSNLPDRRTFSIWAMNQRDFPGDRAYVTTMHLPHIMPSTTGGGGGGGPDPNQGTSAGTNTGNELPDVFTGRVDLATATPGTSPFAPTQTTPNSYIPSDQGIIPSPSKLERVSGAYVAFTAPNTGGQHRLSVQDGIFFAQEAREAQEGFTVGAILKKQFIYFDIDVVDVEVTAAGQTIVRDDTSASNTLTLVVTQRAELQVDHQNADHVVTLLRPETGELVRTDGDRTVVARDTTGTERAEVARYYPFEPSASPPEDDPVAQAMGGTYNEARLAAHGVHVAQDIYVPVRAFQIQVVDTVPVRNSLPSAEDLSGNVNANQATSLAPDSEGFILVPTQIDPASANVFTVRDGGGAAVPDLAAVGLSIDAGATVPAELRAYLSADGIILRIQVDSGATTPASYTVEIPVARDGVQAVLSASFDVA